MSYKIFAERFERRQIGEANTLEEAKEKAQDLAAKFDEEFDNWMNAGGSYLAFNSSTGIQEGDDIVVSGPAGEFFLVGDEDWTKM